MRSGRISDREAYYYYGLYRECAAFKVAKCTRVIVTVAKAPLFQYRHTA